MVKKIGNLYFKHILLFFAYCLFCMHNELHASLIRLAVSDAYGKPLQQVGLGVPFLIEVEINTHTRQKPQLASEHFIIQEQGTSQYTTSINGRSQVKQQYRYIAKARQIGTFELGPATIELNGIVEKSNVLTIEVGDRPIVQHNNQQEEPVRLQLFADKSRAFVGEKIILKLRIYFSEPINIHNILAPDIADVYMYDVGKPTKGIEKIQDKQYEYIEQALEIYPQKPGQLHIPSTTALCSVPIKHDRHVDFFGSLFTSFGLTKEERFYSNGLTITIDSLPLYEKKVNAVGQFTRYESKLDHNQAKQGEGVVLTISLHGDGDLEHIDWPDLELPEGLRAYESKSFLESEHSKKFEYIIQGEKSGDYTIPEQLFTYFDPETNPAHGLQVVVSGDKTSQFKSLNTKPLQLKIIDSEKKIEKIEHQQDLKKQASEQQKSDLNYSAIVRTDYFIPMKLFLWLLILPLIYPLLYLFLITCKRLPVYKNRKKQSFKRAYQSLKAIEKNTEALTLYDIFCNLFVENSGASRAEISSEYIESYLKNKNVDDKTLEQWHHFFKALEEQKFYSKFANEQLIKQSYEWINRLEAVL